MATFIGACIILSVSYLVTSEPSLPTEILYFRSTGECNTQQCLKIAEEIRSMMNSSSDPCDSPHIYFCGNWMEKFNLPDDEASWTSSFAEVRNLTREQLRSIAMNTRCEVNASDPWDNMLGCYYETCMDTAHLDSLGASPLINALQEKTPFLLQRAIDPDSITDEGQTIKNKTEVLSERISAILVQLTISGFWGTSVDPNVLDKEGKYVFYLSSGGLSLQYRQYEQADAVEYYLEFIANLLQAFTMEVTNSSISDFDRIKQQASIRAAEVLKMEQDIKAISFTPEQQRDPQLTTNLLSKQDIESLLKDGLSFNTIFDSLLSMVPTNATDQDKSQIIVDNPSYLENLAMLISSKWSWGAIHDYFLIRAIKTFASNLSQQYRDIVETYQRKMLGTLPRKRWKKCLDSLSSDLGWILSRRYVNSIEMPERRKEIAETMVVSIADTFGEVIKDINWMDQQTKMLALVKLQAITHKLAFPEWLLLDYNTYFTRYYGNPDATKMQDMVQATIHLNSEMAKFRISKLGMVKDMSEWEMYPQDVNAYFNPVTNEIVFPLSILQDPFLRVWTECTEQNKECSSPAEAAFMQLLTFGGLGSIIGHELTHGFDDQGRQFGPQGQLVDWWSRKSATAFGKAAQCISDQYGTYAVKLHRPPQDGLGPWPLEMIPVSGQLSLGENIADNGGLKLAFLTLYRTNPEFLFTTIVPQTLSDVGITSAGLFASAFAQIWCEVTRERALLRRISGDPHSPNFFRILGTLSNSHFYSDAFQCLPGSKMNPTHPNNEADTYPEAFHRSMQEVSTGIKENRANTILFDTLNGVVFPISKGRCAVW